jgi:squalene-associated FAD-dependent desaturase
MSAPTVCVVGAGLAGLAAAIEAVDGGAQVILLESRPRLGGATFSFTRDGANVDHTSVDHGADDHASVDHGVDADSPRDGLTVDNGQHVFLRCCTAYQAFLRRLGVAGLVRIQDRMSVPVITPGGRVHRLTRSDLPAPLHLAGAVGGYPLLSLRDKVTAVRALVALRRLDPDDPRLDVESFGGWLRRHGQSTTAINALWGLISVPTLNAWPDETSLALAAMVFRTGLLDDAEAADIGIPLVPLSRLHGDPAGAVLAAAGADVRTSTRVVGVRRDESGLTVATRSGSVRADAVVLAVPHDSLPPLLPDGAVREQARLAGLGASPIVNLHVVYDRPVTSLPFAVGHGGPVHWVFDRTEAAGVTDGQYLTVSLSAADAYLHEPVAALRAKFLPALAELFPAAGRASVRRFLVTREPKATFRPLPGTGALRPGSQTDVPGVFLAGSWTDTGWPATMEGAVRSGTNAARRALTTVDPISAPTMQGAAL